MAQRKTNVRKKYLRGVVTPSREPAVIGAVCGAIFLIVTILCILDHAPRNTCIVCGVLTALNIPLLLTRNLRIEFHEKKGFVRRNLLGRGTLYKWTDITGIRSVRSYSFRKWHDGKPNDTLILIGQKRIRIHWDAHNAEVFLAIARQYAEEGREKDAADRSEGISEG